MPYRHAHWFVLALFPLAGLAFWPGYLSQAATASAEFHAHGVTATLWLLLLAAQSATMHGGRRDLHRSLGLGSLLLFPLFLAGGAGIFIGMAERFTGAVTPFHVVYAPRLAWLDVVAVAGFAWCYHEALRRRSRVRLHAGYMLATTIFLLPPILGRLAGALPPLAVAGPEDMWKLGLGFHLANALTALIAFALAVRARRDGAPFLIAGGLTVLAGLLFEWPGGSAAWAGIYRSVADLPVLPFAALAGAAGVLVAWSGWTLGRTGPRGAAVPA